MVIRLQKAIAAAGIASRRKAEILIAEGRVAVNGKVITEPGSKVDPSQDVISVDGKRINQKTAPAVMYALYKPKNCVTTMEDPQGRDTIVQYFPQTRLRLFPVGRLDYDSEGLILLTNDGDLAHRITHPSRHVWKQYFVKIKGKISDAEIEALRPGPMIEKRKRQPVKIKSLHHVNDKTWLVVSLQEGLKHHIKKMFHEIGYRVQKIKRFSIGNIELQEMAPGEHRMISADEMRELLILINEK